MKTVYHCRIKENIYGGHSRFKSCEIDKKTKKKLVKKDATNKASYKYIQKFKIAIKKQKDADPKPEAAERSCWDMTGIRSGAPLESSYSAGCPYTCHCRLPREETTISADLT